MVLGLAPRFITVENITTMFKDYANDSALEQRIQIQLGSNKAIIIVITILGDYCKKKKKNNISVCDFS